jgi:Fe-S-cluster-containing dehydrogenase component
MYALLIDVTRCRGCERCVAACIEANHLDPRKAQADRAVRADGLSAHRLSSVLTVGAGRFAKKSCMHCLEPSCVSACLVGGITKSPDGPVVYDADKCIGCRYCMLACPFSIPRYEWDRIAPFMKKCDFCADRIKASTPPACAAACPYDALTFGERTDLLREADSRWKAHPGRYLDRVWGDEDFGGTSVLYLSDVDLATLGWPERGAAAIPSLTEPLIAKTPLIGMSVAGCLLGLHWIVRRRMQVAAEPASAPTPSRTDKKEDPHA